MSVRIFRGVELVEGKRYRIRFKHDNQRREREFVGTYLGENIYGTLDFNLRPDSGTSSISPDAIMSVSEVSSSIPHHNPRMVV